MNADYVSINDLQMQLGTEHPPAVIDVRGTEEYAAGHIPGARHIPGSDLAARLDEIPRGHPVVTD